MAWGVLFYALKHFLISGWKMCENGCTNCVHVIRPASFIRWSKSTCAFSNKATTDLPKSTTWSTHKRENHGRFINSVKNAKRNTHHDQGYPFGAVLYWRILGYWLWRRERERVFQLELVKLLILLCHYPKGSRLSCQAPSPQLHKSSPFFSLNVPALDHRTNWCTQHQPQESLLQKRLESSSSPGFNFKIRVDVLDSKAS